MRVTRLMAVCVCGLYFLLQFTNIQVDMHHDTNKKVRFFPYIVYSSVDSATKPSSSQNALGGCDVSGWLLWGVGGAQLGYSQQSGQVVIKCQTFNGFLRGVH